MRLAPLYQEDRQKAVQEGIEQTAREALIAVLQLRFGDIPSDLVEQINRITDCDRLKSLHRQAVVIPSLEAFQQLIL